MNPQRISRHLHLIDRNRHIGGVEKRHGAKIYMLVQTHINPYKVCRFGVCHQEGPTDKKISLHEYIMIAIIPLMGEGGGDVVVTEWWLPVMSSDMCKEHLRDDFAEA